MIPLNREGAPATAGIAGGSKDRIPTGDPLWHQALGFYFLEAELLDDNRFKAWLDLLADDVVYLMPVRVTTLRGDDHSPCGPTNHFEEDRKSLERRVRRLTDTDTAWAETPRSRTRRFISNLRLEADGGLLRARTNLLLLRSRGDAPTFELFSAERWDVLRRLEGRLLLKERQILVDQSTLGNVNLALFY